MTSERFGIIYYDTTCHSYLSVLDPEGPRPLILGDKDEAEALIDRCGWNRGDLFRALNAGYTCPPRFHYHVISLNVG